MRQRVKRKQGMLRSSEDSMVGNEPLDLISAARLRAERLSVVLRQTPGMMLANVCNALVLVVDFWGTRQFNSALYWATAVFFVSGYIYFRHRRRRRAPRSASQSHAARRATLNALALGLCWAALPLFFFQEAGAGTQLLIACLSAGMLYGGALALASIPFAAMAFVGPVALASFITLIRGHDNHYLLIAAVLGVYTWVLLRGVFVSAEQLRARVMTQIVTEQTASLRMQKLQASGLYAMGGLATGLAHELNQPLTASACYLLTAQRLLEMPQELRPASVEETLDCAAEQIMRAAGIVRQLREFIMRGEPEKAFANLHDLIREASLATTASMSEANVKLSLQLGASVDRVFVDCVQIKQVLVNLISNAIEAMNASAERELTISTSLIHDLTIRIDVVDTGVGFSEVVKENLFEPFATSKADGMGIGLAISRSIVEAHDGKMWAESNPGGGAVFSFVLPLADAEHEV
jgi:C4-dicarboxylate-specific signal transduction histidine kinase